jgi:molybdenum cofactor cytidylyltransferase
VVENPDFADGQSTSVRAGLSRVEPEAEAVLFIPCDLPHLDSDALDRLIAAFAETRRPIVVPFAGGRRRAPVLIARRLFAEIETITGDEGARQLFPQHQADIHEVEFESARPFEDLDRIG